MTTPCIPTLQPMYLGKPGAMVNLGQPQTGFGSIGSRGDAVQTLLSGGTVVTKVAKTKRIWNVPLTGLTEDAANIYVAFYAGAMGPGPYVFVDPAWRNKLGHDVSSMGAVKQAISGWSTLNAGTLAWDGTDAAPFPESDIMTWTGAGNTSKIILGTWSGSTPVANTADAPVYLSDVAGAAAAGSMYFRTASSTASVSLTCMGATSGSTLSGTATTATINSTGWTRLTNYAPSASTTMQYVLLQVACNTSSAPVIWMSAADIQYGPTNAATLAPWVLGLGSPRVVLPPTQSGGLPATTTRFPYRDQIFAMAEV